MGTIKWTRLIIFQYIKHVMLKLCCLLFQIIKCAPLILYCNKGNEILMIMVY